MAARDDSKGEAEPPHPPKRQKTASDEEPREQPAELAATGEPEPASLAAGAAGGEAEAAAAAAEAEAGASAAAAEACPQTDAAEMEVEAATGAAEPAVETAETAEAEAAGPTADTGAQTSFAAEDTDEEVGLKVYSMLLKALFAEAGLYADARRGLLDTSRQLLAYHHAAKLFDVRDAVIGALRGDRDHAESLQELYRRAVETLRMQFQYNESWPRQTALRGKKVFGHRSTIRFVQLPNLPKRAHGASIYLQKRPRAFQPSSAEVAPLFDGSLRFRGARDPLGDAEERGLALLLRLRDVAPDAHVVISPFLAEAETASQAGASAGAEMRDALREKLLQWVARDGEKWRAVLSGERDLLPDATKRTLRHALKSVATEAPPADAPATKGAPLPSEEAAAEPGGDQPQPALPVICSAEEAGQLAYGTLLTALFRDLGYYADVEGGWLDAKKQFLLYHHAAQLAEARDSVMAAIRGVKDVEPELPEAYRSTVAAVGGKLVALLAAAGGQKVKRIFSHDYVIRFHQPPKGLPVPRTACVFLRERPKTNTEVRKTPSLFRDVVRFRSDENPLHKLEKAGLGLVFTVMDRTPRAFLLISPLLEQPEAVAHVFGKKTWNELHEALKEHMTAFIARDSDAWRLFIQRHANIISKDSLVIIQRVLKGCKPGQSGGAGGGDDQRVDEAMQTLEAMAMARAEVECRYATTQEEVARLQQTQEEVEKKCKAAEKACKKQSAEKARILQAQQEAEEQCSAVQVAHEEAMARHRAAEAAHREAEGRFTAADAARKAAEAARRAAEEEFEATAAKLSVCSEEALGLTDSNQELLHEVAEAKASAREAHARIALAEGAIADLRVAEANARMRANVAEARAAQLSKLCETLRAEVLKLRAEVGAATEQLQEARDAAAAAKSSASEAIRAETQARVELELKADMVSKLTASNTQLRTEAALAKGDAEQAGARAAAAERSAATSRDAEAQALASCRSKSEEVLALTSSCDGLRAGLADARADAERSRECASEAKRMEAEHRDAEVQVRATLQVKVDEELRLLARCAELQAEAARKQDEVLQAQESLSAAGRTAAEARQGEIRARAEQQLAAEALSQVTASNTALRVEAAQAKERQDKEGARADAAERAADAARQAEVKARADLAEKAEEVSALSGSCDALRADAAKAAAAVQQATEQAGAAEQSARAAQKAEMQARAELQLKSEEAGRLTESCTTLRTQIGRLEGDVASADERAARSDHLAGEAQRAEAAATAQLQVKAETVAQLTAMNTTLRADAAQAKEKQSRDSERADAAERAADEARRAEADARAELAGKTEEVSTLSSSCNALQAEAAKKTAAIQRATEQVAAAEQSARTAQQSEMQARAELQLKSDEAGRLTDSCVALRAQIGRLEDDVAAAGERVSRSEELAGEARRAEATATAQLQVKAETLSQLTAMNTALRAEIAQAREGEAKASKRAEASERAASEASGVQARLSSELAAKSAELASSAASRDVLAAELASAVLDEQQAGERAQVAEQAAADSRKAELRACAELQAKAGELESLTASYLRAKGDAAAMREELDHVVERVAAAERNAAESYKAEAQASAELKVKTEALSTLTGTNAALRGEVAGLQHEVGQVRKCVVAAESAASAAHRAQLQAEADLAAKQADLAPLEARCGALDAEKVAVRGELALAGERVAQANERAAAAQLAASKSKEAEVHARAELLAKSGQIAQLEHSFVALQVELSRANQRLAAEQEAAKLRTDVEPAPQASQVSGLGDQSGAYSQNQYCLTAADISQLWNKAPWNRAPRRQSAQAVAQAGAGQRRQPVKRQQVKLARPKKGSAKAQASTKRTWKKVVAKPKHRGQGARAAPVRGTPSKASEARAKGGDGPTPKKQRLKSKTAPESLTPQTKTTGGARAKAPRPHQEAHVRGGDAAAPAGLVAGADVKQAEVCAEKGPADLGADALS